MFQMDKEDLLIIGTLLLLLALGWYIIFMNIQAQRTYDCLHQPDEEFFFGIRFVTCE